MPVLDSREPSPPAVETPDSHLHLRAPEEVVVSGTRPRLSRATVRELWQFRDVLWVFAVRFVKVKYKQAAVGIGWAVLQPVLAAVVLALVLGRIGHVPSEGAPFFLFALSGMVAWSFFSTATSTAMESLVTESALLKKVYFPREVVPLAAVGAALVDLAPALITLCGASIASGVRPHLGWIALPIPVLLLVLTASALGLAFSAVNVHYRDVRYALPFLLQLGLFASPVFYSADSIAQPARTFYEVLNPVAAAIQGMRQILLHGAWPDMAVSAGALGWALVLVVAGYSLFKRVERTFADRV